MKKIGPPENLPIDHLWVSFARQDAEPHLEFVQPLIRPILRQITVGTDEECFFIHQGPGIPNKLGVLQLTPTEKKEGCCAFLNFTEGMEGVIQSRGSPAEPLSLAELKRKRRATKLPDGTWFLKLPPSSQGTLKLPGGVIIRFAITDG